MLNLYYRRLFAGTGTRARLMRGGAGTGVIKILSIGIGFLTSVLLARTLGPDDFGIYTYVVALVSFFALPAQFGLPTLVVRETAKAQAQKSWGVMRGIWRWANTAAILISAAIAVASIFVICLFNEYFDAARLNVFICAIPLIPLVALGNIRGAALTGLHRIVAGQLPEHVLRPTLLILFLAAAVLVVPANSLSAVTAIALHSGAAALSFVIGVLWLRRVQPPALKSTPPACQAAFWIRSALPLGITAGLQVVNTYTDILILGLFVDSDKVGIYRVASQLSMLVSIPISTVNIVIAPYISRRFSLGDIPGLQRIITLGGGAAFLGSGIIAAGLVLFGDFFVVTFFGRHYLAAYQPMVILCLGQFLVVALGALVTTANMTGHERAVVRAAAVGAIANIVLNVMLIPPMGSIGAACASVISIAIWRGILFINMKRRLGMDTSIASFFSVLRQVRRR